MKALPTALLALAFALLLAGAASGGNPWRLRCSSMPYERPVPARLARAGRAFVPWATGPVRGLRAGPVYLLAASTRTAISRDGDDLDSSGEYLHRALVAVAPSYTGTVTIAGRRLTAGKRTGIGFSTSGAIACSVAGKDIDCDTARSPLLRFASRLVIPPGHGWRIVPTELRIGRTGCFRLDVSGRGLKGSIPLSVPGPDWGTAGW